MSELEGLSFTELENERDAAYQGASNIFRIGAYIFAGLCVLIWGLSIALLIMKANFSGATLWAALTNSSSISLLIVALIYYFTADFIRDRSDNAIVIGKVVATLSLCLVPIGTILGIIALIRLFSKKL